MFFIYDIHFINILNVILRNSHKLKYFIRVSYKDYKHIYVPTDFNIFGSGLVYCDVRKVWIKSTCATMRLELLKRIQEENLRQIEIFVKNEARSRLSDKIKKKIYIKGSFIN